MRSRKSGNTLILTLALTICLFSGLGFLGIQMAGSYGSKHEHLNATEAAALAGAQALSRIVIEDKNVGFISASDYPPVGSDTVAGDTFAMPVMGINTLAATSRLDLIIADQMNDSVLKRLALSDYYDYVYAASLLRAELYRCAKENEFGQDIDGKPVSIYNEARDAYLGTYQKMAKVQATDKDFKVRLGFVEGLRTNTPIPKPSRFAFMNSTDQIGGFYKSCINIPYEGRNFTFAPATEKLTLIDPQLFDLKSPSLVGAVVPTVVNCSTTQDIRSVDFQGHDKFDTVESQACAYGGINHDTLHKPGTLFLTFDGGNLLGFTSLTQVLNDKDFCLVPTDKLQVPMSGDHPSDDLVYAKVPPLRSRHAAFGQVMRIAVYDWIRRYRDQVNVQSLMDAINDNIDVSTSTGGYWYCMLRDGTVLDKPFGEAGVNRLGLMAVAHKQWRAVSGIAKTTDDNDFDIIVKDYVNRRGRIEGGIHGGEPYPWTGGTVEVLAQPRAIDDEPGSVYIYPPNSGDNKRPGWTNTYAVCAEIRVRKR